MRAVKAALKAGGRHVFYVITLSEGISDDDRTRVIHEGNVHVAAEHGYATLMDQAGYADIELVDVSDAFSVTLDGWIRAWEADSASLVELLGEDDYNDRMERRRSDQGAIGEGLLQRYLVSGVKP